MLVCLKCGTIFEEEVLEPLADYAGSRLCPVKNCGGTIDNIDETIVPALICLNKKGYETQFSCAGHLYEECPNTYIKFKHNYGDYMKLPPEGFQFDDAVDGSDNTIIRRRHTTSSNRKDRIDMIDSILYGLQALNKWAKDIKPIWEVVSEEQKDIRKTLVVICFPGVKINKPELDKLGRTLVIPLNISVSPENYIKSINIYKNNYDIICVECPAPFISRIHNNLDASKTAHLIVYPEKNLKEDYIKLYTDEEFDDIFIHDMDSNWVKYIGTIIGIDNVDKMKLGKGKSLSDVPLKIFLETL